MNKYSDLIEQLLLFTILEIMIKLILEFKWET